MGGGVLFRNFLKFGPKHLAQFFNLAKFVRPNFKKMGGGGGGFFGEFLEIKKLN